jgi:hypothetical protein
MRGLLRTAGATLYVVSGYYAVTTAMIYTGVIK